MESPSRSTSVVRLSVLILMLSISVVAAPVNYSIVGSAGDVITFQIPTQTPTPLSCQAHPPYCFAVFNVTATINGSPIAGLQVDFSNALQYGGLTINTNPWIYGVSGAEYTNSSGPELFSGGISNPTMLLGVFGLATDTCCGAIYTDPSWTLTVTQSTGTPEPSSILLLGAGIFGTLGVVRRRIFKM